MADAASLFDPIRRNPAFHLILGMFFMGFGEWATVALRPRISVSIRFRRERTQNRKGEEP